MEDCRGGKGGDACRKDGLKMDAVGIIMVMLGSSIFVGLAATIARDGVRARAGRNKTITALDKNWNRMNVKVGGGTGTGPSAETP